MVAVNIATTILITSSLRCLIRAFWLLCFAFRKVDNETATFLKETGYRRQETEVKRAEPSASQRDCPLVLTSDFCLLSSQSVHCS